VAFRSKFVPQAKELAHLGGDTAKEITKRILHTMLSDTVASLYSWEGAKGKAIFKKLLLSSVILSMYHDYITHCLFISIWSLIY
jgi:hypothetical protein